MPFAVYLNKKWRGHAFRRLQFGQFSAHVRPINRSPIPIISETASFCFFVTTSGFSGRNNSTNRRMAWRLCERGENSANFTRCLHRHRQKTTRTTAVLRHNSSTRYKLQRSHCLSPEASVQPASLSRSRNP